MKVGRAALDEEAIRLLEELNPDVEFDWTRILKGEQKQAGETRPHQVRRESRHTRPPVRNQPLPAGPDTSSPLPVPDIPRDHDTGAFGVEEGDALEHEALIDELVEVPPTAEPFVLPDTDAPTAAHARLGAEGVVRLRGRYAEILTRISERVQDPVRREQLQARAERLNPDGWVTDDEVKAGLEQYETVSESLRAMLGRRRRRRRRRGRDGAGGSQASPDPGQTDGSSVDPSEVEDGEDLADDESI